MNTTSQIQIVKDLPNKKLTITRGFDAPLPQVWRCWTEAELLEMWWAPKPFTIQTRELDFNVGGHWLYAMVGPDNATHWARVDFLKIDPQKSFEAMDSFCDENGIKNPALPEMRWKNQFLAKGNTTQVIVEISFEDEKQIEMIVQMGFEAGFTAALENLDEVLRSKNHKL